MIYVPVEVIRNSRNVVGNNMENIDEENDYIDPNIESLCVLCGEVIIRDSTEDDWYGISSLMFPEICTDNRERPFNHISVLDY